jgi:hypothetical protein
MKRLKDLLGASIPLMLGAIFQCRFANRIGALSI